MCVRYACVFTNKLQAGLAGEYGGPQVWARVSGGQGVHACIPTETCECGVHEGQACECMCAG